MNINNISPISYNGTFIRNTKKMTVPLYEGGTARFELSDKSYRCIVEKDGAVKQAVGGTNNAGDIAEIIDDLRSRAKDNFDVMKEFVKMVLS